MATKLELVKRPRVSRRTHPLVTGEIRHAYDVLGRASVSVLDEDVADWENKPEFKYKVSVSSRKWQLTVRYDARTKAGKIYRWVDEGTGTYVGNDAYVITPRKAFGRLKYDLPSLTKSIPASGVPSKSSQAPPGTVITTEVVHPGIDPRHFSKDMIEHLKSRKSGSFHNITEAAIKRAFRKLDIRV